MTSKPLRIKKEHAVNARGWSRWVQPVMRKYLMACCDCGLVHEMQFNALRQTSQPNAKGYWKHEPVKNGRVEFRARRAGAATRQLRKAGK